MRFLGVDSKSPFDEWYMVKVHWTLIESFCVYYVWYERIFLFKWISWSAEVSFRECIKILSELLRGFVIEAVIEVWKEERIWWKKR